MIKKIDTEWFASENVLQMLMTSASKINDLVDQVNELTKHRDIARNANNAIVHVVVDMAETYNHLVDVVEEIRSHLEDEIDEDEDQKPECCECPDCAKRESIVKDIEKILKFTMRDL